MKPMLIAICLLLMSAEAQAISRYNSMSMTCPTVWGVIVDEGAVILRWRSSRNPNLPLYGRFVRDDGFCAPSERVQFSYIPTKDRPSCRVLECKPWYPDDDDFWWRRRR